jgi:hypothetical protein
MLVVAGICAVGWVAWMSVTGSSFTTVVPPPPELHRTR